MSQPPIAPSLLLLGGGYTLQEVARKLTRSTFVITSRTQEGSAHLNDCGWNAAIALWEDLDSIDTLCKSLPTLTTVIDSVPPPSTWSADRLTNHASKLGQLLHARGIKRVIYLSTAGVFGVTDGSIVNESTPANPQNPASQARLAVEEGYRSTPLESCALRIPAIYGPERGIGRALKDGTYTMIGDGSMWSNRIHVADLATALIKMTAAPSLPKILCIGDTEPALASDVVAFYCTKFGFSFPRSIPLEQAKLTAHHTRLSNQRIDASLSRTLLDLEFAYPSFREGAGVEFS